MSIDILEENSSKEIYLSYNVKTLNNMLWLTPKTYFPRVTSKAPAHHTNKGWTMQSSLSQKNLSQILNLSTFNYNLRKG